MAKQFYTLIVVPHAKARFRKFQISVKLLKSSLGIAAFLAVGFTVGTFHYASLSAQLWKAQRERVDNSALRAENQEYKQHIGQLKNRVEYLQNMVTKLGVMAGLEQSLPQGPVGGVGGVPGAESLAPSLEVGSLQTMEKSLSELTTRSAKLEEFYKSQTVRLSSTPSIWPVRGYLSSGFGNRVDPFTGSRDFHPGIDISTPEGVKVISPADGVVVSCGQKGAYGNAIIIDHGFGVITRYGHLAAFNVKPGQRVKRGDTIAFVGSTGRSTSPHLHYEVWVNDQNQNPIHFILDEYRSFG
ncbi:MAG TPA: M23 family metallopeptidase [Vicinamibacteria bacterium]